MLNLASDEMNRLSLWIMDFWVRYKHAQVEKAKRKPPQFHTEDQAPPHEELILKRIEFTDKSTIGEISLKNEFRYHTLEDTCRRKKIPKITAISTGRYEVIISHSNRFKKRLPLLLNVPNFRGIRIHSGNKPEQTEGCILVGMTKGVDFVGNSRVAMDELLRKLDKILETKRLFITVIGGFKHDDIAKAA